MKASDVVNRALTILDVIASGETATGNDAADALDMLNTLLAEWRNAEIAIPDASAAELSTELSVSRAHKEALAGKIAERMQDSYGITLSQSQQKNIDEAFNRMCMAFFVASPMNYCHMPSTNRRE